MKNLFDIKGNVTVITGGTGVLGRAIAEYLALNGARVVIMGRREDTGLEIVSAIQDEDPKAQIIAARKQIPRQRRQHQDSRLVPRLARQFTMRHPRDIGRTRVRGNILVQSVQIYEQIFMSQRAAIILNPARQKERIVSRHCDCCYAFCF